MMDWYRHLTSKDRQVLFFGLLFVISAALYAFAYEPLETALEQNKTRLALSRAQWSQLQQITQEYETLTPPLRVSINP